MSQPAAETRHDLSSGSLTVTDSQCADNCLGHLVTGSTEESVITVQGGRHKLILDGVHASWNQAFCRIYISGGAKVTLEIWGENSFSNENMLLDIENGSDVTVTGMGRLRLESKHNSHCILCKDSRLTIESGNLELSGAFAYEGKNDILEINGGSVKAKGSICFSNLMRVSGGRLDMTETVNGIGWADAEEVPEWARRGVNWALREGYWTFPETDKLYFDRPATRAEVAAALHACILNNPSFSSVLRDCSYPRAFFHA